MRNLRLTFDCSTYSQIKVKILQNFVAFSEYINFNLPLLNKIEKQKTKCFTNSMPYVNEASFYSDVAIRVDQNFNKVKYSYFFIIIKIDLEKANHLTNQMSYGLSTTGQFSYH